MFITAVVCYFILGSPPSLPLPAPPCSLHSSLACATQRWACSQTINNLTTKQNYHAASERARKTKVVLLGICHMGCIKLRLFSFHFAHGSQCLVLMHNSSSTVPWLSFSEQQDWPETPHPWELEKALEDTLPVEGSWRLSQQPLRRPEQPARGKSGRIKTE